MATVTVVDATRTLEIEAATIVEGEVDSNGHLILQRHDGTPIDTGAVSAMKMHTGSAYEKVDAFAYVGPTDPGAVPNGSVWYDTADVAGPVATDTQKGYVELATNAETTTGTDAQRAVTPAGVKAAIDASVAAAPGYKTQILTANSKTESASPSTYPLGISVVSITSGWSLNGGFGFVITHNIENDRANQTFYTVNGGVDIPRQWFRTYHSTGGGGGWTPWQRCETVTILTPASFTDSTVPSSYPLGSSRLIYTTANSTNWNFSGKAGEVLTYRDGTNFTKQTFTRLNGGGGAYTEIWTRTASDASGWGAWRRDAFEDQMTISAFGTINIVPSAANVPTTGVVTFPVGRFSGIPNVQVSLKSTVPGSQVTGWGFSGESATGFTAYVTRTNTTSTTLSWAAFL